MRKISTGILLLFLFSVPYSLLSQKVKYSKVKIFTDRQGILRLAKAGVTMDHGERKEGEYFISDFSASELQRIKSLGFSTEVLIDDVSDFYVKRSKEKFSSGVATLNSGCSSKTYPVPAGFKYGSMAGYPTLTEILATLDTLAALYPNLITAKAPINANTTIEGRSLFWVRISNNPNVNQNKPQILYTSLHHAREPASASQLLYYMFYLCENYNTDPEVKFLVDNTEMYFVPCVNPDGYVYNETTNPGGGGLWRKNRRNNLDGTFGVDPNRNYGYNWGYDNIGSSPNTGDDTYRGTGPFSEAETSMMKYFDSLHHFRITLNYHTYGNDIAYPWGYLASLFTPDSAEYVSVCALMTKENHDPAGTGDQTVGYVTNGDADDWGYGDQIAKPKILSMTPEMGSSSEGFWPPMSSILPICQSSLSQNLNAALAITKYAVASDLASYYISQNTGFLDYKIKRVGLDSPGTYTVKFIPISSQFTAFGPIKSYPSLSILQEQIDSMSYTLSASTIPGTPLRYVIEVSNGSYQQDDTITKFFATPVTAFTSNGNSMTGWTSASWGLSTTTYFSPPASITDSPFGNYPDNADEIITSVAPIDLTHSISARLSFWARWEMEGGYDYTEVQISTDNGSTWIPQCGKYTIAGTGSQDPGNPLYNGFQRSWVHEDISLDDYLGQAILLQFELKSDGATNFDGFYFDELSVKMVPTPAGIKEYANQGGVILSQNAPNPARQNTSIHYQITQGKGGVLKVFDGLGRMLYQEKCVNASGDFVLDTRGFSSGVYFYRMETDQGSSAPMRLVISR
jgi:carboxypeptidase T